MIGFGLGIVQVAVRQKMGDVILNPWILTTGFWEDGGSWIDTDVWID